MPSCRATRAQVGRLDSVTAVVCGVRKVLVACWLDPPAAPHHLWVDGTSWPWYIPSLSPPALASGLPQAVSTLKPTAGVISLLVTDVRARKTYYRSQKSQRLHPGVSPNCAAFPACMLRVSTLCCDPCVPVSPPICCWTLCCSCPLVPACANYTLTAL